MATKRDYKLLAKFKAEKSELETKIKTLETKILISPNRENKVETEFGNLCLTSRTNMSIANNSLVIDNVISQEDFNAHAKLSASKLKELVGKIVFQKLVEDGTIDVGEPSEFYTLRKSKC